VNDPIQSTMLTFSRQGAEIRGYAAWPAGDPSPALLLIPDVRGLSPHYQDIAGRFARAGFFTFAIDLYSREGTPQLSDMEAVRRWIAGLPDARVLADLQGAVRFLAAYDRVRDRRIGVTGFCMGGQYALMAACTAQELCACVSWYGMLRYATTNERKPHSPLDLAPRLGCPYLGLFGEDDALIPMADVAELATVLERSGKHYEIETFAGAGHAFLNDTRPDAYRPEAAKKSWEHALAFLARHLKGERAQTSSS